MDVVLLGYEEKVTVAAVDGALYLAKSEEDAEGEPDVPPLPGPSLPMPPIPPPIPPLFPW